jgi:hypothetical protein
LLLEYTRELLTTKNCSTALTLRNPGLDISSSPISTKTYSHTIPVNVEDSGGERRSIH